MKTTKKTVKLPTDPNPKRRRQSQSQSQSDVASNEKHKDNVTPTRPQLKRESPSSSNSSNNTTLICPPNPNPNPDPNTSYVVSTENQMDNVVKVPSKRKKELPPKMTLKQPSSSGPTRKQKPIPSSFTPIIEIETIPNPKYPLPLKKKKRKTPSFTCPSCFWVKKDEDRFNVMGCDHFYCRDCIDKYVGSKLENNVVDIGCPGLGCGGKLELDFCREVLSRDLLDRWGDALCESLIEASQKFYCPYKDCSALLMNDGGEAVMESECPSCRRLFCAQCKVPWHPEIKCEEFQRLKKEAKDDEEMKKFAKKERWTRSPSCNFYVQKISGCNFMKWRK